MRWIPNIALTLIVFLPSVAFAYRPFDGTDADVAPAGEFELEYGPFGYVKLGRQRYFSGPALVANLGLFPRWELVLQGHELVSLDHQSGQPHSQLLDTGLFLKGVLREGSLQNREGLSVVTEFGPLLPTIHDNTNLGATASLIVSNRWKPMSVHFNTAATLTRTHHADLFCGVILEGAYNWHLRPVAELFIEREFGGDRLYSALTGVIWRKNPELSFDLGLRAFRADIANGYELRSGLTWASQLW